MKNIIKVLRAKHELTQEQLAKKIGISRPALSDIENNKVMPSGKIVIRLANVFGIPAEQIFFEEGVIQEEHKGIESA
ncbi:helix-turn-helix transcriptional regulator [Sporanaerobacter acetigenes]|uniref:helix-turn-helix transcriptional regulator n=1 Tax=Sporanaerobacter acetigenes TaxID=165813 RepID=UPI00332583EA